MQHQTKTVANECYWSRCIETSHGKSVWFSNFSFIDDEFYLAHSCFRSSRRWMRTPAKSAPSVESPEVHVDPNAKAYIRRSRCCSWATDTRSRSIANTLPNSVHEWPTECDDVPDVAIRIRPPFQSSKIAGNCALLVLNAKSKFKEETTISCSALEAAKWVHYGKHH